MSELAKKQWESEEYKQLRVEQVKKAYEYKRVHCPEQLHEMYRQIGEKLRNKSVPFSEEHKKAISNGLKLHYDKIGRKTKREYREYHCDRTIVCGKRVYVNNGEKECQAYVEELDWFLANGWVKGRSPLVRKSGYLTQEASDSASGKGKLIVHHKELKEVRRINPDELQSYLDEGWERGYLNKKEKRI